MRETHCPQGTVARVPSTKAASTKLVHNGTHVVLAAEGTKEKIVAERSGLGEGGGCEGDGGGGEGEGEGGGDGGCGLREGGGGEGGCGGGGKV